MHNYYYTHSLCNRQFSHDKYTVLFPWSYQCFSVLHSLYYYMNINNVIKQHGILLLLSLLSLFLLLLWLYYHYYHDFIIVVIIITNTIIIIIIIIFNMIVIMYYYYLLSIRSEINMNTGTANLSDFSWKFVSFQCILIQA